MKSGRNSELDYLLVNLCEQPQQPNLSQAMQHRDQLSLRNQPCSVTGVAQYAKHGPGTLLYFALLRYLIALFIVLTLTSLPSLVANRKGGGLALYGQELGVRVMRYSLANQPAPELTSKDSSLEQQQKAQEDAGYSQLIVVLNDFIFSGVMLVFLVLWHLKSQQLVKELSRRSSLPSYHTLVVSLYSPVPTAHQIADHFSRFATVKHVELIYDYKDFMLELKDFMKLVEKYSQETEVKEKEALYDQVQERYLQIKQQYQQVSNRSQDSLLPFTPIKAFVEFREPGMARRVHGLYLHDLTQMGLKIDEKEIKVHKCRVEPLGIIWENFHLRKNSERARSCLFALLVSLILIVTLFGIFVLSLHSSHIEEGYQQESDKVTYAQAVSSSDPKIVNAFCASLSDNTFEWRYYELCAEYFILYQHKWASVLTISLVTACIAIILVRIVHALAQLRRFRTLPQKQRFLIISIFITYLTSSTLLHLLIRAQFGGASLVSITHSLFPSLELGGAEVYSEMTRKWYLSIGKLLLTNYALTLIIFPWLYLIEQWVFQQGREWWAKRASTQKIMNQRIVDRQFYWQFYYAMMLNSVYSCLLFSLAMPLLYPLALLALVTNFLSSKIIFTRFTCRPRAYDHQLNTFVLKSLGVGLLVHQIANLWALNAEDVFPGDRNRPVSKSGRNAIYILITVTLGILLMRLKRVAAEFKNDSDKQARELGLEDDQSHQLSNGFQKVECLSSYRMEDNPYYHQISYTLMVLGRAIAQHKPEPSDKQSDTERNFT